MRKKKLPKMTNEEIIKLLIYLKEILEIVDKKMDDLVKRLTYLENHYVHR